MMSKFAGKTWKTVSAVTLSLALVACPSGVDLQAEYDLGYAAGFLRNDFYFDGFFDGYDTLEDVPYYYDTSDIPFIDELSYDAGYWDGVWYAYNDGYFVDYHYAFIIGFSEGYDAAFYPDYLAFLASDEHFEFLNGGWGDGYNDGFSEGRIFGAADFEAGLVFDWEDALADYESGTDLYFEEIDLGTGIYGPVFIYEYGTDPADLLVKRSAKSVRNRPTPSIRSTGEASTVKGDDLYRPLSSEAQAALDTLTTTTPRNPHTIRIETTYLDRINAYLAAKSVDSSTERARRVSVPAQ
jgi:hypothetical protein